MAKMGSGGGMPFMMGNMPDSYSVSINGNHPLAQKVLKGDSEDAQKKLAKQVYDLALLSQNMLTGPELTSFIKRSVELIG